MVFIFPLLGAVFSVLTVLIRNISGSDMLFDGFFYFFDYTLLLALCYVAFIVILSLFVDLKKPNEKFSVFYNKVVSLTLKIALSACNVKVKIEGEEKIPKERFLLIQNHKAMFDPVVSLAFLGKYEIGFITKPENTNLPVINKFMHRICCVPIDRENPRNAVKAINAASENIKNNICSMAIYPEGTRSKSGEMLPFHAGSFKIATKSGAPIVVTTVDNTNLVHKNAPFKRTVITLRVCEVIPSEEVIASSTAELSEKSRKIICDSLGIDEK
ncbi:MAG: 1-acyl-sn-glycerol-3-phosphate acyltransferase [Oscillospiraceae bacterium]|nr:1-acyl-sn-glycerol-3-phosphate acyltransferase [Oscillospiraceae bacterium]